MHNRSQHTQGLPHGVGSRQAWVYMVLCSDGTLYTGWTFDLEARVRAHNEGRGARYTAARRPVKLVFSEKAEDRSEALRRERAIKRMGTEAKRNLASV